MALTGNRRASTLTAREAYDIAYSWCSFLPHSDGGTIEYNFPYGNAQIESEDHRRDCIAHTDYLLNTSKMDDEERAGLQELRAYFEAAKSQDELVWWTSSDGRLNLEMTREDADSVSQPGKDAEEDVKFLRKHNAKLAAQLDEMKDADIVSELGEYGTWDEEELSDRDANLMRIVWLAGGSIADGQCDPEEEDY